MADDLDPPRKLYGFKPSEFERANPEPAAAPELPSAPDPGVVAPGEGRVDVRELHRIASGEGSALGTNASVNRENEVHGILRLNLAHDRAAGLYTVAATEDRKRQRRVRRYWTILALVDLPLSAMALIAGPRMAIPFVFAIAGIGMFTAVWTWHTWCLRTE